MTNTSVAMIAVVNVFLVAAASAQEAAPMCYAVDLPRGSGPVRSLRLKVVWPTTSTVRNGAEEEDDFGDGGFGGGIDVAANFWGTPDLMVTTGASLCQMDGTTFECQIECDGGHASILPNRDTGNVVVLFNRFSFVTDFASEALVDGEFATEDSLDGAYILSPLADSECTLPAGSAPGRLARFGLGDVSQYIESAEKSLSALGYPISSVDRIFDLQTQSALRDFQASVGLSSNGLLDGMTLQVLKVHAVLEGGC